jgi:hypothetical protein
MRRHNLLVMLCLAAICGCADAADDVVVWQRSPQETIVYDARPELGIGMHRFTRQDLALLKPLGIRCVRLTLYWNLMEPGAEGQYAATYAAQWDDHVRLADESGICLLAVVHAPPPGLDWAHKELAYERFARFMGAMATRYPSVRYWELFNEMDAGFTDIFGNGHADVSLLERGKLYAQMLKLTYPLVKQANPQAWVLVGGMTDHRDFPRGIYEGGGKPYFDIMNLHTYGVPVTWSFIDRGRTLKEIMRWYGDGDKPLWNTEFGIDAGNIVGAWGYPHNQNPPRNDAEVYDQVHLDQWRECIQWNLQKRLYQKIFPYQFSAGNERNDDGKIGETSRLPPGMTIDDYGFGMVRHDGMTPRPVYEWIRETQPNGPITAQPKRKMDIRFNPIFGTLPPGATAVQWHAEAEIKGVAVDSLYPLVLRW